MPRPRSAVPSYLPHKQSGQGWLAWTDILGIRHQKLLPGKFNSPESLAAKARLELELVTAPTRSVIPAEGLSVAEVLVAYLEHAQTHYRDADGNPSDEIRHLKTVIRFVRELYGIVPTTAAGRSVRCSRLPPSIHRRG